MVEVKDDGNAHIGHHGNGNGNANSLLLTLNSRYAKI